MPRLLRFCVRAALAACLVFALRTAERAYPQAPEERAPEPVVFGGGAGYAAADTRLPRIAALLPQYAARKEWDTLAHALQTVLTGPRDALLYERLRDAGGRPYVWWRNPSLQLNALMSKLSPEALKVYRDFYGDPGRELLTEARKKNDVRLLAEVAQRHLFTDAGPEALALLAAEHLEAGQPLPAALCYQRLLRHPAAKPPARVLYRAAVTLRKIGDRTGADRAWERLQAAIGKDGLEVEGRTLTMPQARQELERVAPLAGVGAADWPMFQGDAARAGRVTGGTPEFAKPLWRRPTLMDRFDALGVVDRGEEVKPLLDRALKRRAEERLPALPGFFPLALGDKVAYRTYNGVTVVSLSLVKDRQGQVEAKPGDVEWKSTDLESSLAMLLSDAALRATATNWAAAYESARLSGILFENPAVGTLSADGSNVYVIDDLALPPPPAPAGKGQANAKLGPLVAQNSLQAYQVLTGKIEWRLGNSWLKDDPFNGSHSLGAPLPLGGTLYALNEKNNGELRLVCLEPKQGKVLSVLPLAKVQDRFVASPSRRVQPTHLAYQDGILVCPTNAGAVLGVDLATQGIVWAYTYREGRLPPPPPRRGRPVVTPPLTLRQEWRNTAPVIAGGKVVFTAPDEGSIHCLNLSDGALAWRAAKDEGDLYLAGVHGGKVLLVGKKACRALDLASGKDVWRVDTGAPSGMGVCDGKAYYLPLGIAAESGQPAVGVLDVETGRVVRFIPAGKEAPGNLLFHAGQLISQGPLSVTAYPLRKEP